MSDARIEIDSGYTWPFATFTYEWTLHESGGQTSSGPIRNGTVFGGKLDGLHILDPDHDTPNG